MEKGTLLPAVNYNYPNKNWLINGDMQVSQRGDFTSASSATSATYYLDRWRAYFGVVTFNKQHIATSQPSALTDSKSFRFTATNTASGWGGANQFIEDYAKFANKLVTVSCWVKSNHTDARIQLSSTETIYGTAHTGGGDWELLTATMNVGASPSSFRVSVYILPDGGGSSSITTGDYVEFTGVKVEIGGYTPFESRSVAEELRDCERFYQNSQGNVIGNNSWIYAGQESHIISTQENAAAYIIKKHYFRTTMRTKPTMIIRASQDGDGRVGNVYAGSTYYPASFHTTFIGNTGTSYITMTGTKVPAGNRTYWSWEAEAEL